MLEALLGTFVVPVEVGVELLAQRIELGLDLLCGGIAADAEGLVVVVTSWVLWKRRRVGDYEGKEEGDEDVPALLARHLDALAPLLARRHIGSIVVGSE